jgi:putative DNA-invertase from lambdoid prophage Rac
VRASPDAAPSRRSGRPRVTERLGFPARFGAVLERLSEGEISRRRAAKELGIGYATLKRLLEADNHDREEAS